MTKIRFLIFLSTLFIVGGAFYVTSLYARGYRFDTQILKFVPNGLLVIKSDPDGAQVFVNGDLRGATNSTIPLPPGTYDLRLQKEDYLSWSKRMTIDKEVVTEVTAHLFKTAPSLSPITFFTSVSPVPSRDQTRIAYIVPPSTNQENSLNGNSGVEGLWVIEMLNLPLGFAREPKRLTDGDLTDSSLIWSPDGREILLTTKLGVYLLNSGQFTPQKERVNILAKKNEILKIWEKESTKRFNAQIVKLPDELEDIVKRKVASLRFSPDEDMILYTASGSATIPQNLKKPLPGSSTQKEERNLAEGRTYVYDIKEDKNFLVDEVPGSLEIEGGYPSAKERRLSWFPTSRHLLLSENDKITVMDYDGTNRQVVYSGAYLSPNAFPTLANDRLLILTNLGGSQTPPNLYSLSIK